MTGDDVSSVASSTAFQRAFLENLSITDGVFLAVLAVSLLLGLKRGFSRETGNIFVWGAALWFTARFNPLFVDVVGRIVSPEIRASAVFTWGGRVFVFLITFILLNILSQQVERLARTLLSGGIDHILGGAFGVVRGYVLLVIFFIVCGWAAPHWLESLTDKSIVAPYVVRGVVVVDGYLPPSLAEDLAFKPTNSH